MRHTLGMLLLIGALAQAGPLEGSRVTRVTGKVQCEDEDLRREELVPGASLRLHWKLELSANSSVEMRFRRDGHREVVYGPGVFVVAAQGCLMRTGTGRVDQFDYKNQPISMATSGNAEKVGGMFERAPVPVAPARPISSSSSGAMMEVTRSQSPPVPASLESYRLICRGGLWWLVAPTGSSPVPAVLNSGSGEVARMTLSPLEPLNVALDPNQLYQLTLEPRGEAPVTLTLRVLTLEEESELATLQSQPVTNSEERARRLQAFADLGAYHQAALEGEASLLERPDDEMLQAVCDLYEKLLSNPRRAEAWRSWGESKGLKGKL